MKYEKIIDLLHEVERSQVEEFELEEEAFRIRIKKTSQNSFQSKSDWMPAAESKENRPVKDEEHTEVSIQEGTIIRSPLVGIFHVCDEQEEKTVAIGNHVEAGQVLGSIEAMKLMNDVVSVCSGTISEILVKDKELVEYGQPLFVIEE